MHQIKAMELTGTVIEVLPIENIKDNFSIRKIVIDTGARYGNTVPLQFTNERIEQIPENILGQKVTVYFDILGNKYQEKYFVNLNAYKLVSDNPGGSSAYVSAPVGTVQEPSPFEGLEENFDDLPF